MVAAKLSNAASVFDAEVAAILWAAEVAANKAWTLIEWSSDAKSVVQVIVSDANPEDWYSRYNLLRIKSFFLRFNWKILWHHRSSNRLADSLAN